MFDSRKKMKLALSDAGLSKVGDLFAGLLPSSHPFSRSHVHSLVRARSFSFGSFTLL